MLHNELHASKYFVITKLVSEQQFQCSYYFEEILRDATCPTISFSLQAKHTRTTQAKPGFVPHHQSFLTCALLLSIYLSIYLSIESHKAFVLLYFQQHEALCI